MHVDAAYAGVAALLPEQRAGLDGLELADSFDTNCHKRAPLDMQVMYSQSLFILFVHRVSALSLLLCDNSNGLAMCKGMPLTSFSLWGITHFVFFCWQ